MGVLIFTHDAKKYRVGDYVEGSEVVCAPNVEGLTVIVHKKNPTAKECLDWLPYISYRMVWVCAKPPKIKKNDSVIIDGRFEQSDYTRSIDATMRWRDRSKAKEECEKVPIPLMLSFLRENNKDIELWRTLAKSFTHVPESFQQNLIAFAHKPVRRMAWPKKKRSDETILPLGVRSSDLYWQRIIENSREAANDLRRTEKDALPKGVKKRAQKKIEDWL
tara:strand:- start:7879 stop:8535 length:657 start_codon:yes stop_codon:yes gene_type:complete